MDWSLLGQVVLVALLVGVGVVVVFSVGLVALSFARDAARRRAVRNVGVTVSVITVLALAWALWRGFELIVTKS